MLPPIMFVYCSVMSAYLRDQLAANKTAKDLPLEGYSNLTVNKSARETKRREPRVWEQA